MLLRCREGLTLIELLLGVLTTAIVLAAILGAYLGQVTLNEQSRNMMFAVEDVDRVMERIRAQNVSCGTTPIATVPACAVPGTTSWDAWLQNCGGGKNIKPNPATNELIAVTCQDGDGALPSDYCDATQVSGEWQGFGVGGIRPFNPIRVTVAVCWRSRGRTIGECDWDGANLVPNDGLTVANDVDGVINSPAEVTTIVTCR